MKGAIFTSRGTRLVERTQLTVGEGMTDVCGPRTYADGNSV